MKYTALCAAVFFATPSFADVEAGQKAFKKQCVACHVVVDPDGNKIMGRSAKTGPNLYSTANGTAGAVNEYRYSKALKAAGDDGLTWTQDNFVAWVMDPAGFLKSFTGNPNARPKMAFKVRKEQDAIDMFDYLVSVQN